MMKAMGKTVNDTGKDGNAMRRDDREIKDREEIIEVLRKSDVCRLALNGDDGYPYIVPLNYGIKVKGDKLMLFFHSALDGKKVDLMKKDNRASFEVDLEHELDYSKEKGYCTFKYQSVVGKGKIRILDEEEKEAALDRLMQQYHGETAYYNKAAIPRTMVYALEVEEITGKNKGVAK